jgi:anthranilate synthase component 2
LKVLIIDNFDSFVYNLAQYVGQLGGAPIVRRNNEVGIEEVKRLKPTESSFPPDLADLTTGNTSACVSMLYVKSARKHLL